ncbi:MAG: hypothetical protein ABI114_13440 [Rhodanobacter sp.]
MRLALTPGESALLLESIETGSLASAILVTGDVPVLEGTADQFDELRGKVSDVLLRVGFDEDYKPTIDGIVLEGLIDKLFVE